MNQEADETNNDIDLIVIPDEVDPVEPNQESLNENSSKQESFSLIQIMSYLFFGSIASCLVLSCYYRLHLLKNKRAPFNAPKSLKPLFPTPVNYEYEITQLCDKYLAN